MSDYQEQQKQVLAYSQRLVREGYLAGTGGNVSMRIPGQDALAITPSNQDYLIINAEDICVCDFEGAVLAGELNPSIEMGFHRAIFQVRPEINCVIHTHQVYASAIALLNKPIPALYDEQVRFLGRSVDIVPYAPSGTGLLVNQIKKTVSNHHNAYIMKNHGALCLGETVERAYHNVLLLEKCALAYILALATGEKVDRIPLAIRELAFSKLRADQKKLA